MQNINNLTAEVIDPIKYVFLDFDGVLTDNRVYVDQNGKESVVCSRLDGIGIKKMLKCGIFMHVVSSEKNEVVQARCKKLGLHVTHGVKDKVNVMYSELQKYGLNFSNAAFVGNDVNDIEAFKVVGLPIGVNDRVLAIDPYIKFITNLRGGMGAVREICDKFVVTLETKN